jgi:hypothetical protein
VAEGKNEPQRQDEARPSRQRAALLSIIRLIERSDNAAHWSPRDAWEEMGKRLDRDKPKCLLIAYLDEQDAVKYVWAGQSMLQRIGLTTILQQKSCEHL